jgi:hypothetical protein
MSWHQKIKQSKEAGVHKDGNKISKNKGRCKSSILTAVNAIEIFIKVANQNKCFRRSDIL